MREASIDAFDIKSGVVGVGNMTDGAIELTVLLQSGIEAIDAGIAVNVNMTGNLGDGVIVRKEAAGLPGQTERCRWQRKKCAEYGDSVGRVHVYEDTNFGAVGDKEERELLGEV